MDTIVDGETAWDASPWSVASPSGLRNLVEGNIAFAPDSVAEMHNRVHVWVGGDERWGVWGGVAASEQGTGRRRAG